MTTYSASKVVRKGLPYEFKCRVYGKYDERFYNNSPTNMNKAYSDMTDYDGFSYTTTLTGIANVAQYNNPTISASGVVSNFTASKYVYCDDSNIDFSSVWRLFVKFTTGSSVSTNSNIVGCNVDTYGIRLGWGTDGLFFLLVSDSVNGGWITTTEHKGTYVIQPNTTYWYVIGWDGANYYGKYSLDGETYVNDISYASTTTPTYNTYPFRLGCNGATNAYPMTGTIDLSECELQTEEALYPDLWHTVWSGLTNRFTIYDFSNTVLPWKWDYENKLQVSRYCLSTTSQTKAAIDNQINGTITGNLVTDSSRNMSGFSSSNYLTTLSAWNHGGTPWKIHLKIKTGATTSADKYIIGQPSTNYTTPQIALNNKTLKVWISSNKSSWNIANGSTCSIDLEPNTSYDVDFEFTGTAYTISVDGVTGLTITTSTADYSGTYPLIMGYDKGNGAFNGSINLSESYIEFDGSEVWKAFPKEVVPSCCYGNDLGLHNNVYVINGNESINVETTEETLNTNATNPRYIGDIPLNYYRFNYGGGDINTPV